MKNLFVAVLLTVTILLNSYGQEKHIYDKKIDSLILAFRNHKSDTSKIDVLLEISNKIKNNNPDSALFYLGKAEYLAKKNKFDSLLIEIYAEIGVTYWQKSEYKPCNNFLRQSLELAKQFKDTKQITNALYNLANVHTTQGNYTQSRLFFDNVLKYLSDTDTVKIAKTYNAIGNIYLMQNDNHTALDYYTKAINLLEKVKSPRDYSLSLNNIGIIYYNQENYEKALQFYHKCLEIKESVNDYLGIAQSYNNLAMIYDIMKEKSKSRSYYLKALEIFKKIDNKSSIGGVLINMAELELNSNNYDLALKYYNESIEIHQNLIEKRGLIYAYGGIGLIYWKKGNHVAAIESIKTAIQYGIKLDAKRELMEQYEKLIEIYIETKQYKHASDYFKLLSDLQKEVYKEENSKNISELQTRFEFQNKEREIELLKKNKELNDLDLKNKEAEVKRQKAVMHSLFVVLIVIITASIIVVRMYLFKRKTASLLLEQKEEISQQKEELLAQSELLHNTNKILEKKNNQITDSITYAEKIQAAILPDNNDILNSFSDSLIIFKPKNIVSGDFYWYKEINGSKYIAVIDCTGHGVPGAFMSMIASTLLNEVVNDSKSTAKILHELNDGINNAFKKANADSDDGLEISICRIEPDFFQISSTNQSVYCYQKSEFKIIEPDILSVGGMFSPKANQSYAQFEINKTKDTIIYLHTDGLQDQLSEKNMKKYSESKLIDLIKSNVDSSLELQKMKIIEEIEKWKGKNEQTDDICLIGFKI